MRGAILSLPSYSCMAWCSVKVQGQFYLYFLPDGKRKLVRYRSRWESIMKLVLRGVGWEAVNWTHLAEDSVH
jgi:nitroimidazol reductase NimA-like FMN-containing flavoprotein (pyridoxamine 5'-phosphate oxidase superfamily)